MKKIPLLMLFLLFFQAASASAGNILVVQSMKIKPYNDALKGFKAVCDAKSDKLFSSETSEADIAARVRSEKPDLILAIGMDALAKVSAIKDTPVIYLMVMNPPPSAAGSGNITGISMNIEPEKQLTTLRQVFPRARKIGLLYDPHKSGAFVRKAQAAAAAMSIELVLKQVHNSREATAAVEGMKWKIDILWLLPDTSVINPRSMDMLLLAAIENRIPVFTFMRKYAEKGALLALEVDPHEAGKQAGEMANRLLAGATVREIARADARSGILTVNEIVAKKLAITLSDETTKLADVIR